MWVSCPHCCIKRIPNFNDPLDLKGKTMKQTNMKRTLSLLLALLTLLSVLLTAVACADSGEDSEETTAANNSAETEAESKLSAYESIPKENLGGEFVICSRDDMIDDFWIEELSGDLLEDSIYERNKILENDFGVKVIAVEGGGYDQVNNTMKLQATGNLDEFDLYIGHKYSYNSCVVNNYCYNMASIDTMDLEAEWWDKGCYENLSFDGKTYVMIGDINPQSMVISSCFVFNKRMLTEMGKSIDELNELATNGGWTLDKLSEYTNNVTFDLNGDGTIEYTSDRYGISSWKMDVPYSLFYGAGGQYITLVDGMPELTYTADQITAIYEKMFAAMVTNNAYMVTDVNLYETCYDVFTEGRALFCDATLNKISTYISDMKDPYGILPVPKFDENQKEYLSFVNGASPWIMIGKTEKDPGRVGTIIEAMSAYNYDFVTPNLFEVVTKLQAAQDPASAAMVDYIIRNRIYDMAYFLDLPISMMVPDRLEAGQIEIAAQLKSTGNSTKNQLKRLLKSFNKCD